MDKINNKVIIFLVVILSPIGPMAVDIHTPSFPGLTDYFDTSPSLVQLTVVVYLLAFAIAQLLYGMLSDVYGRRKVLLFGLFLFIVSALASYWATSIGWFLLIRFVQGLGIASAGLIAKTIVADCFQDKELLIASTYLTVAWGVGLMLSPFIGGYIYYYFNWQFNFLFLSLYGSLLFIIVYYYLPETIKQPLPWQVGKLLKNYYSIALHKPFMGAVMGLTCSYSTAIVFAIIAPYVIQDNLGYDAVTYANYSVIVMSSYFCGAMATRFLVRYFTSPQLIRISFYGVITLSLLMLFFAFTGMTTLLTVVLPTAGILAFSGMMHANNLAKCFSSFPKMAGSANAVLAFVNLTSIVLFSTMVSVIAINTYFALASYFLVLGILSYFSSKWS